MTTIPYVQQEMKSRSPPDQFHHEPPLPHQRLGKGSRNNYFPHSICDKYNINGYITARE